ncbi:MAG TPA: hypothetical protein PKL57_12945, partial [Candidatus Wallbacteria bacterium]|nr:hypothetical protein [Candidatus Wallbacteria bacterium]
MNFKISAPGEKLKRAVALFLAALVICQAYLLITCRACLAQVELKDINSQINILQDGRIKVKYRLQFLEKQSRDLIKTVGPFDPNHAIDSTRLINSSTGEEIGVSLIAPAASIRDSYGVKMGRRTQPGESYDLSIAYSVSEPSAFTTQINGADFAGIEWNAPQWALPIDKQTMTFITPIELPDNIKKPEDITDPILDTIGVIIPNAEKNKFDRFIPYPTPDEQSQKIWLSFHIEKSGLNKMDNFGV